MAPRSQGKKAKNSPAKRQHHKQGAGQKSRSKAKKIKDDEDLEAVATLNNVTAYVPIAVESVELGYLTKWGNGEETWEPASSFRDKTPKSPFAKFQRSAVYVDSIRDLDRVFTGAVASKPPGITLTALAPDTAATDSSRLATLKTKFGLWEKRLSIIGGKPDPAKPDGGSLWAVHFQDEDDEPLDLLERAPKTFANFLHQALLTAHDVA